MTKSEARAIEDSTGRALRILYGTEKEGGMPYLKSEDRQAVYAAVKTACEEIERVRAMALQELGGK
jgi:hypothetical protein